MEEDKEDDDFFADSNGAAYLRTEERTGPPLTYVAEKIRHSLESLHQLNLAIEKVPDDVPAPGKWVEATPSLKDAYLRSPAQHAFHYGLVGYLALFNLLALANDHNLVERLLRMSRDEFTEWLERIAAEGSVTG